MKKKILSVCMMIILIVFMSSSIFAGKSPIEKGGIFVSGGFNYSNTGGEVTTVFGIMPLELFDERLTQIQFDPSINFFVVRGLALGLNISLVKYSFSESDSEFNSSISAFGIGPQLFYFFGGSKKRSTIKGSIYPYLGVAYMLKSYTSKYNDSYGNEKDTEKGSTFRSCLGISYMISDSVGIFGEAVYVIEQLKGTFEDLKGNSFNIALGFKIFL